MSGGAWDGRPAAAAHVPAVSALQVPAGHPGHVPALHCPALQTTNRVWLIGEQRWENRARITKRDS